MNLFRRSSLPLLLSTAGAIFFAGCGASTPVSGTGAGGGSTTITATPLTAGGAAGIYAGSDGAASGGTTFPNSLVLQFAPPTTASATPAATLATPAGFFPTALTFDTSGQLYVGGFTNDVNQTAEVLVFAAGATGTTAPLRTIIGSPATFYFPSAIAVDASGLLYVLSGTGTPAFDVFSSTANGAATPLQRVTGPLTQILANPVSLAVDKSGTIYVANFGVGSVPGTILAFAPGSNGNAAPTRVITGAGTSLSTIFCIDVDSTGNIYVLNEPGGSPIADTILEFASTATGNVAPIRTIAGSNTGLGFAHTLRVDKAGNIYVLGVNPATFLGTPYVAAFASTASGNVPPAISFTSTAWPPSANYDLAVK